MKKKSYDCGASTKGMRCLFLFLLGMERDGLAKGDEGPHI